ncbi:MAG: hypothetical protein ABJ360_11850 [Roseobacter sp.]
MADQINGIFDVLFDLSKAAKKSGRLDLCEDILSVAQAYDTRSAVTKRYEQLASEIFETCNE